ncbi:MAG: DUF5691 domain-containing protein [Pseudomonadota bacterium]
MRELENGIAVMRGRWLMGAAALESAPESWRIAAEGDPEPELVLLALAAQAGRTAFRPAPDGALVQGEPPPELDLPVMPQRSRAAFRTVLQVAKPAGQADMMRLLAMVAARGWVVHPLDHLPEDSGGLPAVYAPWAAWAARSAGRNAPEGDWLDTENFDLLTPQARRRAVEACRGTDPATARDLIAERGRALPAEQRLALVAAMVIGLGEDDVPFLEGLASDRSAKVRLQASGLLARLGRAADDAALATELADFHAVGRRMLGLAQTSVGPATLKTEPQRRRRDDLYGLVSLDGLAGALGIGREPMLTGWRFKEMRATAGLVQMLLRTGSNEDIAIFATHAVHEGQERLGELIARLAPSSREALIPTLEQVAETAPLVAALAHRLGTLEAAACERLAAVEAVVKQIRAGEETDRRSPGLNQALFDLGLIADAAGAARLLDRFAKAGLARMDPGLALLRFNAGLEPADS